MAETDAESAQPIAEISHGPSSFESFLDRNQKILIGIGVLAALGIGAAVVMTGVEEGANREGGEALLAAKEIAAMQEVVTDHAKSPSATSAAVLLSDLQWEQGQQSAAIETLEKSIAAQPDHPASLPAQARLGARLMEQGSLDKAGDALQKLVDNPKASYLAPYALASLSEIAAQQGDEARAESLLEEARISYPESPFRQTISEHQRFIGFQMPTEIDPPAPEPIEDTTSSTDGSATTPGSGATTPPSGLNPSGHIQIPGGSSGNPLIDVLGGTPSPTPEPMPAPGENPTPVEEPSETPVEPTEAPEEPSEEPSEPSAEPADTPEEAPTEAPSAETPPAEGE